MPYVLSEYGCAFITTEESFAAKAYDKDGHWTIGYGHTGFMLDGSAVDADSEVTKDQAVALFKEDIQTTLEAIWKSSIKFTQYEVDALVSLLFNCGVHLLGQDHDLGSSISKWNGNGTVFNLEAIANAILEYDKATINGIRGPFLATRRKAEHDMFLGAKEVSTPSGLFYTAAIEYGDSLNV